MYFVSWLWKVLAEEQLVDLTFVPVARMEVSSAQKWLHAPWCANDMSPVSYSADNTLSVSQWLALGVGRYVVSGPDGCACCFSTQLLSLFGATSKQAEDSEIFVSALHRASFVLSQQEDPLSLRRFNMLGWLRTVKEQLVTHGDLAPRLSSALFAELSSLEATWRHSAATGSAAWTVCMGWSFACRANRWTSEYRVREGFLDASIADEFKKQWLAFSVIAEDYLKIATPLESRRQHELQAWDAAGQVFWDKVYSLRYGWCWAAADSPESRAMAWAPVSGWESVDGLIWAPIAAAVACDDTVKVLSLDPDPTLLSPEQLHTARLELSRVWDLCDGRANNFSGLRAAWAASFL